MILLSPISQAETREDDAVPSLELLEFLAEWETDDGQWLDPEALEDDDFAKLVSLTYEENE